MRFVNCSHKTSSFLSKVINSQHTIPIRRGERHTDGCLLSAIASVYASRPLRQPKVLKDRCPTLGTARRDRGRPRRIDKNLPDALSWRPAPAPADPTRCRYAPQPTPNIQVEGDSNSGVEHFTDDFSLCASHLAKHATFQKTHFLGTADLTASRFVGARFAGHAAHFAQTQFDNAAYFEQAAFAAPATFTDAAFAGIASFKETSWAQPLSFAGVRFADRAIFWDVYFAAEVSFDSGRADGDIAFDRARFSGAASFADFTFARAAHFGRATFGQARFDRAYFRQEADFSASEGRVLRLSAFFNRSLDLSRAAFALIDLRPAGADSTFAAGSRLYWHQPRFGHIQVRWLQLAGHLAPADSTHAASLDPTYAALYHNS